jgi:hypothetical protein
MMHFIYICPKSGASCCSLSICCLTLALPLCSALLRLACLYRACLRCGSCTYLMLTPRARYALLLVLLLLLSVLHAAGGLADCADRPYRSAASRAAAVPYSRGRRRRGRAWRSGGIR